MKKGKVYARRRAAALILVGILGVTVVKIVDKLAEHVYDATTPDFVCHVNSVVAEPGDTIWDLVREYCDGDVRYVEWLILEIRGTADLDPGDVVIFPVSTEK